MKPVHLWHPPTHFFLLFIILPLGVSSPLDTPHPRTWSVDICFVGVCLPDIVCIVVDTIHTIILLICTWVKIGGGGVRTAAPRPAFRTQQSEWLFFRIPFFMGAASPYNRNAFTSLLVWAIIWKRAVYLSFSSSSFFTLSFVSMYRDISLEIIETSITRPIVGRIVFTLPSSFRLAIIRLIGYAGAVT